MAVTTGSSSSFMRTSCFKGASKSYTSKRTSKLSPAVLSTAVLLVIFAADTFFGDTVWANLAGLGSGKAAESIDSTEAGSRWCLEWTLAAWAMLMVAWCAVVCWHREIKYSGKHAKKAPTASTRSCRKPAVSEASSAAMVGVTTAPSPLLKFRSAIEQAARDTKPELARSLIYDVIKAGLRPDNAMPNMVMRAYTKSGDMKGAERWLEEMKQDKLDISACTYNTLMDACGKANRPDLCEMWLSRMTAAGIPPNAVSYTTAIYAHSHRGGESQAEALMMRMQESGVQPDAVCFNALIHACSVNGNIAGVDRWVNRMEAASLKPSVTTFTAAIDACAKQGEVLLAESWMERLLASGLDANVVSYSALMNACAKAGNQQRAAHWYERMIEVGVTPNSHSFSAAIAACARTADVTAAEQWLVRAQDAGLGSDPVIYSGVIDTCAKANDADRAWKIFQQMRASGVRPHIVLYGAIAKPFAHKGNYQRVEEIAQIMQDAGVVPNEYFLYAHLLAYSNARPKEAARAEVTFKQAAARGTVINDHVLNALGRCVGRARVTELRNQAVKVGPVSSPKSYA